MGKKCQTSLLVLEWKVNTYSKGVKKIGANIPLMFSKAFIINNIDILKGILHSTFQLQNIKIK